ncbi:MAG: ribonuclease HII [Candidatus Poseidoniales archaeon]
MSRHVIGIDEAGRGPVIGPLVVCALKIPKSDYHILKEIGVDDSKKLTRTNRKKIYKLLMMEVKNRNWNVFVNICSAYRVDIERSHANLNTLEVKLFAEAIIELSSFEAGDQIRVDACDVNERRFGESIIDQLGNSWKDNEIISKHKMDELDAIVGAASIIAKVTRDEEIIKIENKLDHKIGSGYPSDPITILAIKKMILGKCPHKELRWSWKTTKKAWLDKHDTPLHSRGTSRKKHSQTTLDGWME